MKEKYIETKSKENIVEIHRLLKECVEFGHFLDWNFTKENLKKIVEYKKIISNEEYLAIEKICQELIFPAYFDENFREFIFKKEFGDYNEEGAFVINSEDSIDRITSIIYIECVELGKRIDEAFSEIWNLKWKFD